MVPEDDTEAAAVENGAGGRGRPSGEGGPRREGEEGVLQRLWGTE